MKNVIVISAHPDDETLGAGGTLLKHRSNGDKIYWLIATKISEEGGFKKDRIRSRAEEIQQVTALYGFSDVFQLAYDTMQLTSENLRHVIKDISEIFTSVRPHIIYTVNRTDAHSDHRILFDAVAACTKSFRYPFIEKVLMYECISETEFAPAIPEKVFQPNYFVDITAEFSKKIEIMNVFSSEIGEHPFPRSMKNIEALATFRGAIAGVVYAEAFQLVKLIEK